MRTILLLTVLFFAAPRAKAQPESTELRTKLDARVAEYSLSANGLADAFARTSKQFQIPIGIEWVKDAQALQTLDRRWTGQSVRQILHSIVEAYPGYDLRAEDNQVHVFRQDLLNDSRNFLNLRVPDFFDVHQQTGGFVNVRLQSVIQNIVSPRNLPPGAGEAGSYTSGNVPERSLSLILHGLTVREALAKLVVASERHMWIVTFPDSAELTPTGFRLTETLWHPSPFSDAQQPMWDFLAWGEYPPTGGVSSPQD